MSAQQAPDGTAAGGGLGLEGGFAVSPDYAGCPGCGALSYCKCGGCEELGCWDPTAPTYHCVGCGSGGAVGGGSISTLRAKDIG